MIISLLCFIGIIGAFSRYKESTNIVETLLQALSFFVMVVLMIMSIRSILL